MLPEEAWQETYERKLEINAKVPSKSSAKSSDEWLEAEDKRKAN